MNRCIEAVSEQMEKRLKNAISYGAGGLKPGSWKQFITFNSIINLVQGERRALFLCAMQHCLSGDESIFSLSI